MKIDFITFTGPDDRTKISDIETFMYRNPNTELGVLLSQKTNRSRFPTGMWVDALCKAQVDGDRISGHLCGKMAIQAACGAWRSIDQVFPAVLFAYYQINLFGFTGKVSETDFINGLVDTLADGIIIQADGVNDYLADWEYNNLKIRVLQDKSGGNGVIGEYKPPHPKLFTGYAGGLNPTNIVEEMKKLGQVVGDRNVWIDMESGVRTNDEFDLEKCQQVYDLVYSNDF